MAANNSISVFSHTYSLALHPHYDNEVDVSFTLPTFASTLPILDPPHAGHEFCLRAFTFVEDIRRHSDDGDVNPRPSKRHTRHSPTSSPRQEQEEAKTLYVFSVSESFWRSISSQHVIADSSVNQRAQRRIQLRAYWRYIDSNETSRSSCFQPASCPLLLCPHMAASSCKSPSQL